MEDIRDASENTLQIFSFRVITSIGFVLSLNSYLAKKNTRFIMILAHSVVHK
jgi:hypothetical protein